ncbi:hypothetical protein JR065_17075 [Xanthomonas sp. AmX2]|uniref:hypothetical protein n=1 Tax=Xanthomonas sp. TaxID=29446 RepID=UPI0019821D40|nr:hypothetical protein [Xanthomonas sp.]MBN6152059.1 hypothetical protein [Xanthomonas sp.]
MAADISGIRRAAPRARRVRGGDGCAAPWIGARGGRLRQHDAAVAAPRPECRAEPMPPVAMRTGAVATRAAAPARAAGNGA